jgi:hypothetical protein
MSYENKLRSVLSQSNRDPPQHDKHVTLIQRALHDTGLPKRKEELPVTYHALGWRSRNLDPAQGHNSSTPDGHQHLIYLSSLGFSMYMPR